MPAVRVVVSALLVAIAVIAVMLAVRFAVRGSSAAVPTVATPTAPSAGQAASGAPARPVSAAASEMLTRIRGCSDKELESVIDRISPLEALDLYRRLTPADREMVLGAVPAPILARKAQTLLGIPDAHFRHADQRGRFASTLVDAAMGAAVEPVGPEPAVLRFAIVLDGQQAPINPRRIFRPDERRIYACLDHGADSVAVPGVLVRWSAEGSSVPLYLHYLPLALNRRWNYVYYEAPQPWPAGTYRVSLFSLEQVARLLAVGTFVVESRG